VPQHAAMITFRDGSRSLQDQSEAALNQLYETYNRAFSGTSNQPQLVLVTHSAGGVVSRAILSNPWAPGGAWGFDSAKCERADYITDRVVFLVALATPHTGSPLSLRSRGSRDDRNNNNNSHGVD
jgi:triacylglycerol esterase/lipase EstA (alpha/beta hydrolase family)